MVKDGGMRIERCVEDFPSHLPFIPKPPPSLPITSSPSPTCMGCAGSSSQSLKLGGKDCATPPHEGVKLAKQDRHVVSLASSTYGFLQQEEEKEEEEEEEEEEEDHQSMKHLLHTLDAMVHAAAAPAPPRPWAQVSSLLHSINPPPPHPPAACCESECAEVVDLAALMAGIEDVEEAEPIFPARNPPPMEDVELGAASSMPHSSHRCSFLLDDAMLASCEQVLQGLSMKDLSLLAHHHPRPADPFHGFQQKCPPGGAHSVVLYTTSLRGIRKTYEDCCSLRSMVESLGVRVDERDVAMDLGFRNELKEMMGSGVGVPRLFIRGWHIGGVEEARELNEVGKLWEMVEGIPMAGDGEVCRGCGGARFVPCRECNGSCRVVSKEDKKHTMRCPSCNENGLVQCSICHH